jgi:hypothetical protein
MMDGDLGTASRYINNLLASRGLLQDGIPIQFVNLGEPDDTAARIINLVHDLILKNDVSSFLPSIYSPPPTFSYYYLLLFAFLFLFHVTLLNVRLWRS